MTPALFLDRDGVINVDHAYVHRIADFEFIPGIFDLVRAARALHMRVVVVTNQAGIGRGLYTEADFAALTAWMCERFAEQGAAIDRVYHCPTHPTEGIGAYRVDSPMRKPHPGMLLAARDALRLDMPGSAMLGDKVGDLEAGLAAGVGLNMLLADAASPLQAPPGGERVATLDQARQRLLQHRAAAQSAAQARAHPGAQPPGPAGSTAAP
jgi:D-glycero-D-manno-heptose 1,7-bisphosphate phosphatase